MLDRHPDHQVLRRLLFCSAIYHATVLISVVLPFVWSAKRFIDGARIIHTQPGRGEMTSYDAARIALRPIFTAMDAMGLDIWSYGRVLDGDFLLINIFFGTLVFALVAVVMLAYELPSRFGWDAVLVAGVVVGLSPWSFVVSKEIVPLALCTAVLLTARAFRWSPTHVAVVLGAGLVLMSFYYRAYYLVIGALLVASFVFARRPRMLVLLYLGFFVFIFVAYQSLPLDEFTKGRADYLADTTASRISYPFGDGGRVGFTLNRFVTFLSLLVPVTLPLQAPAYLPFAGLQLAITWRMLLALRPTTDAWTMLAAHVTLAVTATSALFEPDYGSYFRHKVGFMVFLVLLLCPAVPARWGTSSGETAPAPADPDDRACLTSTAVPATR